MKQIWQHLRRLSKARRFGVPFLRHASFKVPAAVRLEDQFVSISSPNERGAATDFIACFLDDEYGLGRIEAPVRTIADIGANIGFFSMAARAYFPGATIHAYEPNPRVLPYCSTNAAGAQFSVFSEAVGSTAGFVSIEDSGDSNQARTISSVGPGARVPQVSLSRVVERLGGRVDLVKIDCEGAEWELFAGSDAWADIGHLRMEYHLWGKHTYAEVQQACRRLGFEIHRHRPFGEWGTVWARNVNV